MWICHKIFVTHPRNIFLGAKIFSMWIIFFSHTDNFFLTIFSGCHQTPRRRLSKRQWRQYQCCCSLFSHNSQNRRKRHLKIGGKRVTCTGRSLIWSLVAAIVVAFFVHLMVVLSNHFNDVWWPWGCGWWWWWRLWRMHFFCCIYIKKFCGKK